MEIILANAKLAGWLRSFSGINPPKLKSRMIFQWMNNDIIPYWMFDDTVDSDIDDDDYFDEYTVYHHSGVDAFRRINKIVIVIFIPLIVYACVAICLSTSFLYSIPDFIPIKGINITQNQCEFSGESFIFSGSKT